MKDSVFRLSEIAATQAALADEAQRILADLAGAGPGAGEAPSLDAQEPPIDLSNLIALKVAAARWGRSVRNIKKIAADHGALAKVGGRNMVDHKKLQNAIFARL